MLSRRAVLTAAPAALGAAALAPHAVGQAPAAPGAKAFAPRVVRVSSPENLEGPFHDFDTPTTPTAQHYVRSHFPTPQLDPATFAVSLEGHVARPFTLTLAQLKALPPVTRPLTLECAGNGRVFLAPAARGVQWGLGAVATAEWTGVPLSTLLERAGVKPGAVEVILVGADVGAVADPATPGPIPFDRSIPLAKALKPEVLIAHGMNGADLLPGHGAPFRAVVGGYYGMASVKWLARIVVVDRPYAGYWQTIDYATWTRRHGLPALEAITAMQPKASIARPAAGETVRLGQPCRVRGFAWAGESAVAKVEFSADAGATWTPTRLAGPAEPFRWRSWDCDWTPTARGPAQLLARATDAAGATQPKERSADRRTYVINHWVPVAVVVS